jgi:hypothetical protein
MEFKFKLLIIWVAVMAIFVIFLWLRPFNEIILLALVFALGLLGIMLYTREHKDSEAEEPEISQ